MKANNIAITIPYKGCDKDCQYCVSKMTGYIESNEEQFLLNLSKARKMAEIAGITSVSITGKGEPLLNLKAIRKVLIELDEFPIEIQTNGLALLKNLALIDTLALEGVDIFAISMDKISDFEDMEEVMKRIHSLGKLVRVTMNVTDMLPKPSIVKFVDYIDYCKTYNVDQFSLRQITVANNTEENDTHKWIGKHVDKNGYYAELIRQFESIQHNSYPWQFIRALPYGAKLYDVRGVSFTYFDYCVQDSSNGEDIRSLIYDEQGHLGTSWVSNAGRIF